MAGAACVQSHPIPRDPPHLQRMTFYLHFSLSLWKNWVQKKRAPCTTCCELLAAPILVALFAWLYQYVDSSNVPSHTYECTTSFSDSGITDFVYLPRMLNQSNRVLGVVGPPGVRAGFMAYLGDWYPGLSEAQLAPLGCSALALDSQFSKAPPAFPGFQGYTLEFDTEGELEAYVLGDRYGQDDAHRGLHMAVVFHAPPAGSPALLPGGGAWSYTLRSNITDVPDVTKTGDALQTGPNYGVIETYFSSSFAVPGGSGFTTPAPGLIPLQLAVDRYILGNRTGGAPNILDAGAFAALWNCSNVGGATAAAMTFLKSQTLLPQRVRVAPFPTFPYRFTSFYALVGSVFPLLFTLAFLFPAFFMIRAVVQEKEARLREGMRMMGMNDLALTGAWYVTYILQFGVIALIVTLTVATTFYSHTDGGVLFVLFFAVGLASTALCFLISVFFSRSKMASLVGIMLFLAAFFPYFKVNAPDSRFKALGALSHTVAFGLALDTVTTLEASNQALGWGNLGATVNGYSLASAILAILGDALLYTLLALYLSEVVPQEYGVPLPWSFPINPAHWAPDSYGPPGRPLMEAWRAVLSGRRNKKRGGEGGDDDDDASTSFLASDGGSPAATALSPSLTSTHSTGAFPTTPAVGSHVEMPGPALLELGRLGRCVSLRGLTKVFHNTPDGSKTAVAGVDLDMYEGQITALLGHNGAGKSTTISMLTGLIPPSGGDAWAYGKSITRDLAGLRSTMGVCPQHDVLWPDLTVREHLVFFARMKGVPAEGLEGAVGGVIRDVGLTEKVDALSKDLSGGMKRKLSVGIALIGDPSVVFLDEPTSGMDPYSRRFTWNILQNARAGRVMVLTTHFMDEADILGDRIAIMADGVVRCAGSPMYLKKMFGVGYSLTVIKAGEGGGGCNVGALEAVITAAVPAAARLSNVGAEVSWQLPLSSSPAFPALFHTLEVRGKELGVSSYGVSVTTMEQVFVKVAEEGGGHGGSGEGEGEGDGTAGALALKAESSARRDAAKSLAMGNDTGSGGTGTSKSDPSLDWNRETEVGDASFWRHFKALLHKRRLSAQRDRTALLCQLAIPFAAVLGGLVLLEAVNANTPPALHLSLGAYNAGLPPWHPSTGSGGVGSSSGSSPPNFIPVAYSSTSGVTAPYFHTLVGSAGVTPGEGVYTSPLAANATFFPLGGLEGEYNTSSWGEPGMLDPNCTALRYQRLPALAAGVLDGAAEGGRTGPSRVPNLAEEYALSQWLLLNATPTAATTPVSAAAAAAGVPISTGGASYYGGFYVSELFAGAGSPLGGNPPPNSPLFPSPSDPVFASYSALVNSTAWHITPTLIALANSGLLNWVASGTAAASISGGSGGGGGFVPLTNASIDVTVQPLPFSNLQRSLLDTLSNFFAVLFIVIAFSFIPASFAVYVVKEREVSAKHQQLISGVSIPAYWAATYAWDCANYAVPAFGAFFLLLGFNQLVDGGRWPATLLLFILYGTAVAPFTYILTFAFASHSSAQLYLLLLNLLCMVLLLASFVMKAIPATCAWDARLRFLYRLLPTYALGNGLQQLSFFKQLVFTESQCGTLTPEQQYSQTFTPFSPAASGWPLAYLAGETLVYGAITVGIDVLLSYPILRARVLPDREMAGGAPSGPPPGGEDSDVATEGERVARGKAEGDTIVLAGLRKVYGGAKAAVRSLSFGIPSGEVFGFLGINGAGKTTTLKILSGEDIPTAGTARLDGLDILTEQLKVRRLLGYCPQFDALLDLLTVREHLELYARIKGVPEPRLPGIVGAKIAEFDLVNYANKLAGSLSGGNKRKLSVAISMIGSPRLIFLDEPSTGMDPVARRFMWRVINSIATERKTCSIILTTHSMEEAEALCGRIGIMVGGRLRCLGSVQHLKGKFGQAYTALFKVAPPGEDRVNKCLAMMAPFLRAPGSSSGSGGGGVVFTSGSAAAAGGGYTRLDNPSSTTAPPVGAAGHLGSGSSGSGSSSSSGSAADLETSTSHHQYDTLVVPMDAVASVCSTLGDASRVAMIHPDSTGWALAAALKGEGGVGARAFAEWWTAETRAALVHDFIGGAFPAAKLVERAGGDFLRYSIPSAGLTLSSVFGVLEANKERLAVVDYSLGETSLEQIFNVMAADQDEEKGSVRGMGEKKSKGVHTPSKVEREGQEREAAISLPRFNGGSSRQDTSVSVEDTFAVKQLRLN